MRARVGLPMVKSRSANMTSTIGDKISYSLVARTFKIEVQQIIRFFLELRFNLLTEFVDRIKDFRSLCSVISVHVEK